MRKGWSSFVALLVLLTASTASAQSAYQLSRDGRLVLIQKDVGQERWIVFHDPQAGTIHGNVFLQDQSDPAFVSCDDLSNGPGEHTFVCYGAGPCTSPPCRDYAALGEVSLPDSFLRPPAPADGSLERILSRPASIGSPAGARSSGIQLSHDGSLVFVQKDVGAERWAILHDPVGGSIHGSVFSTSGGDSVFLDCERTALAVESATFECFAAGPCASGACQRYEPLGSVTLPSSFLRRPRVEVGWASLPGSSYDFVWSDDGGVEQHRPIEFTRMETLIPRLPDGDPLGARISVLEVLGTGIAVPPTTVARIADIDPQPFVPFDFAMFFGSMMVVGSGGIFEICESLLFSVDDTGEIRGRLALGGPCSRSPVDAYDFMKGDCTADTDACGLPVNALASSE